MSVKLTDAEARKLLEMTKRSLLKELHLPEKDHASKEFKVEGETKKDLFIIRIFRGNIRSNKFNIGARIKVNDILLLELHINPTAVHQNPDGEKITTSHWHIYTEQYGRAYAVSAEDIESDDFVDNTIMFLNKFNVIEQPKITYQINFK